MDAPQSSVLHYKRSQFATALPVGRRYSPSHYWMEERDGVWRVGFTKFATRMLGEMVDHQFDRPTGAPVNPGDVLGWIEGFKAISDLFCVIQGTFQGGNPALSTALETVSSHPYHEGWLYEAAGEPDPLSMDVVAYRDLLDATITRMLEQQDREEAAG